MDRQPSFLARDALNNHGLTADCGCAVSLVKLSIIASNDALEAITVIKLMVMTATVLTGIARLILKHADLHVKVASI